MATNVILQARTYVWRGAKSRLKLRIIPISSAIVARKLDVFMAWPASIEIPFPPDCACIWKISGVNYEIYTTIFSRAPLSTKSPHICFDLRYESVGGEYKWFISSSRFARPHWVSKTSVEEEGSFHFLPKLTPLKLVTRPIKIRFLKQSNRFQTNYLPLLDFIHSLASPRLASSSWTTQEKYLSILPPIMRLRSKDSRDFKNKYRKKSQERTDKIHKNIKW